MTEEGFDFWGDGEVPETAPYRFVLVKRRLQLNQL